MMYPISDIEFMPGKEKKNAMMRVRACTRDTKQSVHMPKSVLEVQILLCHWARGH